MSTTCRSILVVAVAVSLLQSMDCLGQTVISFAIQHPTPGTFATNQLFVQVSVASTYEVQSVSATLEGQTTPLVFSSTVPGWTNTLSLLGLSHGQKTLTIAASDVFSNSAQTQTVFLIDFPPTLTITEPRVGTVARPQHYRLRRILEMVREGTRSGLLPNCGDFVRELGHSRLQPRFTFHVRLPPSHIKATSKRVDSQGIGTLKP